MHGGANHPPIAQPGPKRRPSRPSVRTLVAIRYIHTIVTGAIARSRNWPRPVAPTPASSRGGGPGGAVGASGGRPAPGGSTEGGSWKSVTPSTVGVGGVHNGLHGL